MSFGKRVDGPGGRRRIKRRPVHIRGSAITGGGARSVVVEDLCLIGARLVGHDLPAPGGEIVLRARERSIAGRIAWADDDRRGIIFGMAPEEAKGH
jgi:hypothetical protein